MDCSICKKPIENYNADLNHLKIDDENSADICQGCLDKIFNWQGSIYAKLFPTKAMKKRFGKK